MLDIPSISAMVAATSVIVSATFALVELRNMAKNRQMGLLLQLQSAITDKEYRKAWRRIRECRHASYSDCLKIEYEFELIIAFFDSLGILLHRKLVKIAPIEELFGTGIIRGWERSKVYVEGARKEVDEPKLYWGFEFLYKEIRKREQH